jgi:hypothetical protein
MWIYIRQFVMQNIGSWSWRLKLIGFWNSWKVYKPIKRFDIDTGSSVSISRRLTSLYVMDVLQKWFLTAVKHQWKLETRWYRGGRKKTSYPKVFKFCSTAFCWGIHALQDTLDPRDTRNSALKATSRSLEKFSSLTQIIYLSTHPPNMNCMEWSE